MEQETAEAVRAGWLDEAGPGTDPARAALEAGAAEESAAEAADHAREAAASAAGHIREAAARHSRAELAAARAADAARAARTAHAAERDAAAALGHEERLGELLGLPGGEPLTAEQLDEHAEPLAALLETTVGDAERQLFDLRTAAADDSRILGALGDGGLLPAGPDVLATVEFLGENGIPALPGWRYLAQSVDPADHAAVLAARPELVDGVVITDPESHARAREALAAAALLPRSAVAVGTAAALLAPTPPAADDAVFLVPPNPAMHDERAADTERHELRRRAQAREEEIRTLAGRLGADRALAARLASWRAGCPAGRLAELTATAAAAREAVTAADNELAAATALRAEAEEAGAEALRLREERQEALQRARRRADALAGLAFRLRERSRWQSALRELAEDAAEDAARAEVLLERARAADEDRRTAQRTADDARRTARVLRAERAEIGGPTDPGDDDTAEDTPPEAALPALREQYRTAARLYDQVGVDADLRAEQARAEGDATAAQTALDRLGAKVRARAAKLLETTDGADGPSRQAAAARAEAQVQLVESRASTASEQLGRLRGEAERHAPSDGGQHTDLPQELEPRDAGHARELLRTASAEEETRRQGLETAREAHADLQDDHRAAQDATGAFEELAAQLRDLLREPGGEDEAAEPGPYPGGPEEARRAAAEARRSLRGCASDLSAADSTVREASDQLVRHANATRYEQVRTPARQQIRELPAAALPDHAAAWAEAFAPRLRVLTDELEQLERNRGSIVARLRGLVDSSLATLRSAQRLSRLPEGLGEWSGQEFVRIRFEDPDPATLTERLGEVVDETTSAAVRRNTDLRRDGMSLLLRGVEAALRPRGVSVEILKPDAVLRAERVPVGQMGDVFSGGQLLTAAIALYCTMAALRSNDRGRDEHRHAGTLFLDNPIGRANATYLLELQRAVSDALGVQLLYTTGLFDTTALAEFPLVIRLRNDADLRAGLKYIRVEEHLRPGLPAAAEGEDGTHSEITATRMYRRPRPELTAHPARASVPAQHTGGPSAGPPAAPQQVVADRSEGSTEGAAADRD